MSINVDPAEIAKFSELAHRWWDSTSDFKPLHDINPLRLNYIDGLAGLQGKTVLDVGCGGGILAESMMQRGALVTGIDLAEQALKVAALHSLESGVAPTYLHASAEDFARDRPQQFDVVTCMELLEHVPDPASTVRACAALAKAGGHVFFSTINRNLKSYVFAVIGAEYVLRMLPRGTHRYEKFVKPSQLGSWSRQSGLDVREVIGMTYNPLTGRYALGTDTDVNYLMHCTA